MERHGVHNLTRSYFSKANGVILVCDPGDMQSLTELDSWIDHALDHTDDRVVLSVWANNSDCDVAPFEEDTLANFADSKGIPCSLVFHVIASSGDNLMDSFRKIVDAIHLANTNPRRYKDEYGIVEFCRPEPDISWWNKCKC